MKRSGWREVDEEIDGEKWMKRNRWREEDGER
jgi:hypothetical protein